MLRPAEERDLEAMLAWRNQAPNREVSIHWHMIAPEEHREWWARVRDEPTSDVLIFEWERRPLGVVSFSGLDLAARSGSWGFYLDNETTTAQGITLMAWMRVMREGIDYAFDQLGLDCLNAEVLADNHAVRSMNRRFGFAEGDPVERTVDGRTVSVIPISLARGGGST